MELTRFSLFLGIDPLENEALLLPEGPTRCKPGIHLMVELRLCVARFEAQRDSLIEARKHLKVASRLLDVIRICG